MKRERNACRVGFVVDLVGLIAAAFGVAAIGTGIWSQIYLDLQGVPLRERLPDPYLALASRWIFRGLFVVVLLMGLARFRRRSSIHLAQARTTPANRLRRTWLWQFAVFIGHVLLAFSVAVAFSEWATWIYVRWYALDEGVPLHELGNDLGFGMAALFVRCTVLMPVFFLALLQLRTTYQASQMPREVMSTEVVHRPQTEQEVIRAIPGHSIKEIP